MKLKPCRVPTWRVAFSFLFELWKFQEVSHQLHTGTSVVQPSICRSLQNFWTVLFGRTPYCFGVAESILPQIGGQMSRLCERWDQLISLQFKKKLQVLRALENAEEYEELEAMAMTVCFCQRIDGVLWCFLYIFLMILVIRHNLIPDETLQDNEMEEVLDGGVLESLAEWNCYGFHPDFLKIEARGFAVGPGRQWGSCKNLRDVMESRGSMIQFFQLRIWQFLQSIRPWSDVWQRFAEVFLQLKTAPAAKTRLFWKPESIWRCRDLLICRPCASHFFSIKFLLWCYGAGWGETDTRWVAGGWFWWWSWRVWWRGHWKLRRGLWGYATFMKLQWLVVWVYSTLWWVVITAKAKPRDEARILHAFCSRFWGCAVYHHPWKRTSSSFSLIIMPMMSSSLSCHVGCQSRRYTLQKLQGGLNWCLLHFMACWL